MDNKYGLGSKRLATEHHQHHQRPETQSASHHALRCRFCQSTQLRLCPTMQDHQCDACGEWQLDTPVNYAVGRSSEY